MSTPFLFKVLSVSTALSIQAHPDAEMAQILHSQDPQAYPDPNHKPEMAIAVSQFEALCSFKPQSEVEQAWQALPPLSFLTPVTDIRSMFARVMRAEPEKTCLVAEKLLTDHDNSHPAISLFKRLWSQYPSDVGCFCAFLMNRIVLSPGQAIFLPANEPHAYISGQCMECMAASDNVVRAGLTPKPRDVDTLLKILTYKQISGDKLALSPRKSGWVSEYRAPVTEFAVDRIEMPAGAKDKLQCTSIHSILITMEGEGRIADQECRPGSVFYLSPGSYTLQTEGTGLVLFRAFLP